MADAHAISLHPAATPDAAHHPINSARRMYAWRDAIWASDLSTTEKIVALAYADHASSGTLRVWVAAERLQQRTGLKRTSSAGAVRRLRELGWLTTTIPGTTGATTRYALTIPDDVAATLPAVTTGGPSARPVVSADDERVSPRDDRVSVHDPDPLPHPSPHPTNQVPTAVDVDAQGQEQAGDGLVEEIRSHPLAVGLTATAVRTHAASLRAAGWTRATLAAELGAQDFTGARGPGLLRYRLAALATSTPPQPVTVVPAGERDPSPVQRLLAEHDAHAAARPATPETIAAARAIAHRRIAA
ncbi:hypothetical protein [Oerskovia paurometabola]|uniref:hypothetical protein n=1 Tax=Oerskovia paurometabola TaxID=162170 RepID=UPI00380E7C9F